ncbi:amidohydrolase [Cytobacillus oceanisediminis]|uniref:amidohydrolase n=1 Tax=Cytobacillus oceanisediminis TaxID=665099 RepID=UPI0037368024
MMMTKGSIYFNGKIFTANPEQPYASAMAVLDGKIIAVGEKEEMPEIDGDQIDLQGKRVLPGLIDAHLHPLYLANAAKQIPCTPPVVYSIEDLIAEIKKQVETEGKDKWVEAWGYDEGKLEEGRTPTRWDLDRATLEVPVVVTRTCGHIVSVNSIALELAGITRDTPNPFGGEIDRDEEGVPTGILRENARNLVFKAMPVQTLEDNANILAELSPFLLSHGITGITDLLARKETFEYIDLYNEAAGRGLKQRSVLYYVKEDLEEEHAFTKTSLDRENQIFIGGMKMFADGSVSGQTAWVNPPFLGRKENSGIQMTTREELLAGAEMAERNGVQLAIHAMGEQAIDLIVDSFHGRKGWLQDGPSIRIEHAAMPTDKALRRAAEAGIAFVPQTVFLFAEIESYIKNLGAERTKRNYPVKTMLESGILTALSSDAPATAWADPVNPFIGIQSAVTRVAYDGTDTGQEERVDVETAIELYTREAQKITRIPGVGQLAEDYYADFIVLDRDILAISPEDIGEVTVEKTYLGGELVFEKEAVSEKL